MSILDLSKKDQASTTKRKIKELLDANKIPHEDYEFTEDLINGQVGLEGMTFGYSGGALVMIAACLNCGEEVASKAIKRLADIADLQANFRPGKHNCFDGN